MAQLDSPLSPSLTTGNFKRPSHNRQSSTKSLSFLVLSSSPSSSPVSPSSYLPSPIYAMYAETLSRGLQTSPPTPNLARRASDGYTSSGSTIGSETMTPSTPTVHEKNSAPAITPPRVKRSCSTSALTALSLSSAASPRIRQISSKATVA